jgi:hypothetical protein
MTEVKELIKKYGEQFVLFCTDYVEGAMLDAYGAYGILKKLPEGQEEAYKKAYKKNINKCVRDKEKNQKLLEQHEEEKQKQEEQRIKKLPEHLRREFEEMEESLNRERDIKAISIAPVEPILVMPSVDARIERLLSEGISWFAVFCVDYVIEALGEIKTAKHMDEKQLRKLSKVLDKNIIDAYNPFEDDDDDSDEENA